MTHGRRTFLTMVSVSAGAAMTAVAQAQFARAQFDLVRDFLAVGDGATDNAAALRAFNLAAKAEDAAGRGVVLRGPLEYIPFQSRPPLWLSLGHQTFGRLWTWCCVPKYLRSHDFSSQFRLRSGLGLGGLPGSVDHAGQGNRSRRHRGGDPAQRCRALRGLAVLRAAAMKILVTGGAGYIGSHACKALAAQRPPAGQLTTISPAATAGR